MITPVITVSKCVQPDEPSDDVSLKIKNSLFIQNN